MLTECPRCYTSLAVGLGQSPRLWCSHCGMDMKALALIAPANTKMGIENTHLGEVPVSRTTIDAGCGLAAGRSLSAVPSESASALNTDGPPERVFRPSVFWQAAFLVVALICLGIAFACFSPYLHRPLHTAPGSLYALLALFTAGGLASGYGGLRLIGTKYLIYPECLVYVRQGEATTIPWNQIRSVIRITGPGFRIAVGKGQILHLNGEIGGFFKLGNLIEERMAKSQLPALLETLEAGNLVSFGPISADKTGIYCQEYAIPWLRLLSLSFGLDSKEVNWRKRIRKGLFLRVNHEIQIKIGEMRNYRLFEMMVLHHQPACQVQPLDC
jgi:hypothetical protein